MQARIVNASAMRLELMTLERQLYGVGSSMSTRRGRPSLRDTIDGGKATP
jgi:hypothetical protein